MWGFCVPLARRPSPRLSASSGPFAGFAGVSKGACMQHGVGIDAVVQRWCSNAVMQRCSDARLLPGAPWSATGQCLSGGYSSRSAPRARELLEWTLLLWRPYSILLGISCRNVPTCQRAHDACSATCFQGRGGTEVHGANRGHDAREAVGRL